MSDEIRRELGENFERYERNPVLNKLTPNRRVRGATRGSGSGSSSAIRRNASRSSTISRRTTPRLGRGRAHNDSNIVTSPVKTLRRFRSNSSEFDDFPDLAGNNVVSEGEVTSTINVPLKDSPKEPMRKGTPKVLSAKSTQRSPEPAYRSPTITTTGRTFTLSRVPVHLPHQKELSEDYDDRSDTHPGNDTLLSDIPSDLLSPEKHVYPLGNLTSSSLRKSKVSLYPTISNDKENEPVENESLVEDVLNGMDMLVQQDKEQDDVEEQEAHGDELQDEIQEEDAHAEEAKEEPQVPTGDVQVQIEDGSEPQQEEEAEVTEEEAAAPQDETREAEVSPQKETRVDETSQEKIEQTVEDEQPAEPTQEKQQSLYPSLIHERPRSSSSPKKYNTLSTNSSSLVADQRPPSKFPSLSPHISRRKMSAPMDSPIKSPARRIVDTVSTQPSIFTLTAPATRTTSTSLDRPPLDLAQFESSDEEPVPELTVPIDLNPQRSTHEVTATVSSEKQNTIQKRRETELEPVSLKKQKLFSIYPDLTITQPESREKTIEIHHDSTHETDLNESIAMEKLNDVYPVITNEPLEKEEEADDLKDPDNWSERQWRHFIDLYDEFNKEHDYSVFTPDDLKLLKCDEAEILLKLVFWKEFTEELEKGALTMDTATI